MFYVFVQPFTPSCIIANNLFVYRPLEKSLYDEDVCLECQCLNAGVTGDNLDCKKVWY